MNFGNISSKKKNNQISFHNFKFYKNDFIKCKIFFISALKRKCSIKKYNAKMYVNSEENKIIHFLSTHSLHEKNTEIMAKRKCYQIKQN